MCVSAFCCLLKVCCVYTVCCTLCAMCVFCPVCSNGYRLSPLSRSSLNSLTTSSCEYKPTRAHIHAQCAHIHIAQSPLRPTAVLLMMLARVALRMDVGTALPPILLEISPNLASHRNHYARRSPIPFGATAGSLSSHASPTLLCPRPLAQDLRAGPQGHLCCPP